MNKMILAATAVAAVALTSGCKHTTVVRTTHHPVEVIDSRTVVHERRDVHVHEHREAPRHTTRVIKEYRTVEPVYHRRHDHDERRRHVYEESRPRPPAHSNSRHVRGDEHPRPPVHSNSRHYRNNGPEHRSSRYSVSSRHEEPRYTREQHARPSPVISSHGDSALSRAVEGAKRRAREQASSPARLEQRRDARFDSRSYRREQPRAKQQHQPAPIRHTEKRRDQTREVRPQHRQRSIEATHRNHRPAPQVVRTASPKIAPPRHEPVKQVRESKKKQYRARDKHERDEKRSHGRRDDKDDDDKRRNDRSARNYRN